ncbi:alpha-1,3-arabinosyltransferase XAT3-like [Rhododendron vialii]|uniref:alpha-1,3-arabinosyltransferase XAT3-like n=1 Tax=Rhododendron vialii TaxID=182163 RepID=UPI00265E4741|nr:alpha-1,3-arabinosyltransferase XAT3-like [Rhododendron vialii]
MEKEPRSLIFRATPLICLLLLSLLYTELIWLRYTRHCGSDQMVGNQEFRNWCSIRSTGKDGQGIDDQEHLNFLLRRLVRGEDQTQLDTTGFACHSDFHTDVCVASRPVRIDMRTMKVYATFSRGIPQENHIVRPYARKADKIAMSFVSPVQILQGNITPPACQYTHNVPAAVFSSGGYTGNLFHEFNEIIIPLFVTYRPLQSRLRFIVTDFNPPFSGKVTKILSHLSSYEVINPAADQSVHCFPGAVVGLHYHDYLAINTTDIPGGYSMLGFKQFLRESYNLKVVNVSEMNKPVLILLSRPKTRTFLNEDEMVTMMKALGFRVIVARPHMTSNLDKFAQVVNSCSVMVGAHGAGLTNAMFLPQGAVLVQVVPLGLRWLSARYFGGPAKEMGLKYVKYQIEPVESSLLTLYGQDHPVITNPASLFLKGYMAARAVYIDAQNLTINVVRFRETLVKARGLLERSAPLG